MTPPVAHRVILLRRQPSFDKRGFCRKHGAVVKLCIFVSSTAVSYLFWWLADLAGADFLTSFLVSGVGALAGCWVGWKIYVRYFNY